METPWVSVIMGSTSDWDTMRNAADTLEELGVPHEVRVLSAHRTLDALLEYLEDAEQRGMAVVIAAAGGAAHLAGVIAARTVRPVLGVPMQSASLQGLDSLLSMVQICKENVRSTDYVSRYGGDEFAVILPDASLKNAKKRAKVICKKIASTKFNLDEIERGLRLSFSVSVGVSCHGAGDTPASLTERADQALYVSKRKGKNQVASEDEIEKA